MGGLAIWEGRRRFRRSLQRVRPRHAAGVWWRQRIAVGMSLPLLLLLAAAAYGQRLTLTPSLSLSERYDDNIFATLRNKQDDFITVLSPGLRARYLSTEPTLGTQFDASYRADFEFFADNSGQDHIAHRLSLTLASSLAPSVDVRLRDLFLVTDEPFGSDERLSDPTGLRPRSQQQRSRTIRNEADGRADVRLGGRLSLGVLFGSLIEDVDVPEELDEFRYRVGTELGYAVNVARDSRVFIAYEVTFHHFSDNGIVVPGQTRAAFRVHAVSTGWRHQLTPTWAVNTALGYTFTTSDAARSDDREALAANLLLTKTFKLGQASLSYIRHFISGEGQGGVVLADTVRATASVNLTGKLTARLDSNVSWFDFQNVTTRSTDQDQRFWSVRPSLTYQILRPWSASLAYIYELTHFAAETIADRTDHRLFVETQVALREWLVLGLSYRYSSRLVEGNVAIREVEEFSRNQVMLTLTAIPNFRF